MHRVARLFSARHLLVWMMAIALVVAGLPVAHVMQGPTESAMAMSHAADAPPAHHHDGMVMESSSDQGADDGASAAPCKCLHCSLCVASFVPAVWRDVIPDRRLIPVVYRIDPHSLVGIAAPVDPGIPILAS